MGSHNTSMKLPSSAKSDNNRATKFQQTPPTYEESTQNVVEKYKKQVQYAKTPEDLLEPLLSDMGIYEKRKLIEDAPSVWLFRNAPRYKEPWSWRLSLKMQTTTSLLKG